MEFRRQDWYRDDRIMCYKWATKDVSSRCELDPAEDLEFFKCRWLQPVSLLQRLERDVFAVMTYVLPKFDSLFHHSLVPMVQLKRMDSKIRTLTNIAIGG
jgi:hypothetical protein